MLSRWFHLLFSLLSLFRSSPGWCWNRWSGIYISRVRWCHIPRVVWHEEESVEKCYNGDARIEPEGSMETKPVWQCDKVDGRIAEMEIVWWKGKGKGVKVRMMHSIIIYGKDWIKHCQSYPVYREGFPNALPREGLMMNWIAVHH